MSDIPLNILYESWSVLGQMAPYLLFGFLVAGVLSVCISPEFVERHLGGRGFLPVLKAALWGVPLPLCSCGVIPVSASIRRHGASRAATTSFLLSTPQTGVDSIAVTYALLGTLFAVYRPLVALATGLLGGLLVLLLAEGNRNGAAEQLPRQPCEESCCAGRGTRNVVRRALEYGFVVLPRDIGLALLAGVVIAGFIGALVPANQWHAYLGGGVLSIVLLMGLGIPLYVCASASVPIAAGLIHAGALPGAALAFLIAGPATNAATITTIWKVLGRRTALLYLGTIAVSAIAGGLLLDQLMPSATMTISAMAGHSHDALAGGWSASVWAILLLSVLALSYAMKARPETDEAREVASDASAAAPDERLKFSIEGMSCGHCAAAVTKALRQCQGVESVHVDVAAGRAVVTGDQLDPQCLIDAVTSSGYRATALS